MLFASNAWLKGLFGYGEIATDIPFLLFGLVLFFTCGPTGAPPTGKASCSAPPASATVPTCGNWKRAGIS